ncbi:MAG: winged helix-turn-helix domain-containing protein [Pseudomonadota bacterium]
MLYRFDEFSLDTDRVELSTHGAPVLLEPKAYDLLKLLVENNDRVIGKDEIFEKIWPGLFLSDGSISAAIKQIRRALGDDGDNQRFVKTLRGKGFRFVAAVSREKGPLAVPAAPQAVPLEASDDEFGVAPVVAVLPFALVRSEDEQKAIADAIPTELIAALSRIGGVRVIARASTFQFGSETPDFDAIHERLGANHVASGSVELIGSQLIISAELSDARSHRVLWSERYKGALRDIFELRQSMVHDVCMAVDVRIPINEAERLQWVPTENLNAWGHYHLGVRLLGRFTAKEHARACHHFEQAIALDPSFARAHASLSFIQQDSDLYSNENEQGLRQRCFDLASKAMDLDPYDPFCNLIFGRAKWAAGDFGESLALTDRSVALNPNYAFGHYNLGKLKGIACDGQAADEFAASAATLSPLDPNMASFLSARALAGFVSDDERRAILYADQSLSAINPHVFARAVAASIYAHYGHEAKARRTLQDVSTAYAGFTVKQFQKLFELRDADKNAAFQKALERVLQ